MMLSKLTRFVPQRIKNIAHASLAWFAAAFFGFPAGKLRVIGVTGTDGKTTTVQCIGAILRKAGKKVAVASTINFCIGDEEYANTSKFTTLSGWKLQRFLSRAVSNGCEYALLEVSSHALDQGRIAGISFEVAVVTNVTREHLDYHGTMKQYRRAKRRLFERTKIGVVNLDMDDSEEFIGVARTKTMTYSRVDPLADILAERVESNLEGSSFAVGDVLFRISLPGLFNIENSLAAISATLAVGIPLQTASQALGKIAGVPGRMERVPNNRGITILIDYAVTPHALEALYGLVAKMKSSKESKIIAVFGACGDRDRGKRPIMGEIVSSYADIVILTNEDPYTENPSRIVREIKHGISNKIPRETIFVIMDRRKAIGKALRLANPGDVVVVTGKGAEETMAIGKKRIPWNDQRVILEELQ